MVTNGYYYLKNLVDIMLIFCENCHQMISVTKPTKPI